MRCVSEMGFCTFSIFIHDYNGSSITMGLHKTLLGQHACYCSVDVSGYPV